MRWSHPRGAGLQCVAGFERYAVTLQAECKQSFGLFKLVLYRYWDLILVVVFEYDCQWLYFISSKVITLSVLLYVLTILL